MAEKWLEWQKQYQSRCGDKCLGFELGCRGGVLPTGHQGPYSPVELDCAGIVGQVLADVTSIKDCCGRLSARELLERQWPDFPGLGLIPD